MFRGESNQLVILFYLSGEFFQHLSGQFHSIVVVLRKLHELHKVPLRLIALLIRHLAVIVIQFVHGAPVFSIPNPNDDNA